MQTQQMTMGARAGLAAALVGLAVVLGGCPQTGVVCAEGFTQCGSQCVDVRVDKRNCGTCGVACQELQVCLEGGCQCREGTTACEGSCVDTRTSNQHCGACGNACSQGEVCQDGACQVATTVCNGVACGANQACVDGQCACAPGFTACGTACVNTQTDAANCGGCGSACEDAETCHQGACAYDVVAVCGSTSQLVGLNAAGQVGKRTQLPEEGLQSVTVFGTSVLASNYTSTLYQTSRSLELLAGNVPVSGSALAFHSEPPYLYVVNSAAHTLQVLKNEGAQVQPGEGELPGLAFTTVKEVDLGENTWPQAVAKLGNTLYIPLFGDLYNGNTEPGQKVARVDVTTPEQATLGTAIDLSGLDLQTFEGHQSLPLPQSIAAYNGAIYVGLTNINPQTFKPGGPGLLAKIAPANGEVTTVSLDANACLNVIALHSAGDALAVSCAGDFTVQFTPPYPVTAAEKTSVLLVGAQDQVVGAPYVFACGEGCTIPVANKLAAVGNRLYVGDQSGGRVVVLEVTASGLVEVRGFGGQAAPVEACPMPTAGGSSIVSDIVAVP